MALTAEQVERAFAEHAEMHAPFRSPGVGAWAFHCPVCGGGSNVRRTCDSCGKATVEEVEG